MKRHAFHCEKCESECLIYRKGKAHRVLVCPKCGILATNGKKGVLKKVAKKTAKGLLRSVPIVGDVAAELITKDGIKTSKSADLGAQKIIYDSKDKPNYGERVVNKVLYGE